MQSPSELNFLTPAQLDLLRSWLEAGTLREAHQRIAKPPPEGLGIQVCLATVARFAAKMNGVFAAQAAVAAEETWAEICQLTTPINSETEIKMVKALSKFVQD